MRSPLTEQLGATGEAQLASPIELMRFTLVYRGPLHAQTRKATRLVEKHKIRKALHRQLQDVWRQKPTLSRELQGLVAHGTQCAKEGLPRAEMKRLWDEERTPLGNSLKNTMRWSNCGPFMFIPLVTSHLELTCELDVLMLRTEAPKGVFKANNGGDLDNRLKVLFDALRVPGGIGELPNGETPEKDKQEQSVFCLLEDDSLITACRVESERLFSLEEQAPNYVELTIRVSVKTDHLTTGNLDIVGVS